MSCVADTVDRLVRRLCAHALRQVGGKRPLEDSIVSGRRGCDRRGCSQRGCSQREPALFSSLTAQGVLSTALLVFVLTASATASTRPDLLYLPIDETSGGATAAFVGGSTPATSLEFRDVWTGNLVDPTWSRRSARPAVAADGVASLELPLTPQELGSEWTFEAWVRIAANASVDALFGDGSSLFGFVSGSSIEILDQGGGWTLSAALPPDQAWHHLAVRVDRKSVV